MEAKIEKGRALVLAGPPGCGKTRLARSLAAAHGTFVETDSNALLSPFKLGWLLAKEPATIVVHDVPAALITRAETRHLVASELITMHRRMRPEEEVPTPNFIFCTGDANALGLHQSDRRFTVVRMAST